MSDEFVATLSGSFEYVRETVVGALKEQGYGVLTSVDVRETLRDKLDAEVEAYEILGVCNPSLAYRALEIDRRVGLLLPCSVTLRETDVGVEVRVLDPQEAFRLAPEPALAALEPVASEARDRLVAAIRGLSAGKPHAGPATARGA